MNRSLQSIFTLLFVFFVSIGVAQQLDMEKLKGLKPRSIGPAGMSGRITAIDVVVSNPDIMYAGAASGGVWKTTSGGITWEALFDEQTTLSIGAIAIQQDNPSVVWVGTGEGNPRNSLNGGYGIYRSLDAGKTWTMMGLEKTRNIHRIVIDPKNPNTVYVGAIGSPWGEHPERGVFKTTDGGQTWTKSLFVDNKTGCAELVMDPVNPNKLIASMWQHRRTPWDFTSGGPGSGMYITHDGGTTWTKKTDKDGLPEGELGRMGLAIARSNPDIIYALIESKKNALYKSTDGGFKWRKINDKGEIGNRPFYYFEIYVDPLNENRIYSIFSVVNISEDGGESFHQFLPYSGVHPDHHAWWIHPTDPSLIVEGNDGGLNISYDRGKTWRFVENIPVAQPYHVAVDMEQPYHVYGGMQDNGSWIGPAYVWKNGGIRNSYWQELMFGDGFDMVADPDNSRFGYAMSQQGNVGRYDRETGYVQNIRPTHPDPDMKLRFNWNSALAQDPKNNSTIYFGSQFVHKSTDKGNTWEIISPDLTSNDPKKQKQTESGGLTIDATGAENHTTILAIEPSAVDSNVLWVGTDDGKVQITKDGGKSWTEVTAKIAGMPAGAWVPQIRASAKTAGEAYVIVNNYRQFDFKPYLFRTRDFGQSWESVVSSSQVGENAYTLGLAQDPIEPKLLFLGTDNGLFVSLDEGKNWTRWTNGFPAGVPTMDLVIHPREHDLVIATFGRAFYVLDDIRPLREMAQKGTQLMNSTVHIFPAPDAYLAATIQPEGIRFNADAMFEGENRPEGALITYAINKPAEKKAETPAAAPKKGKKSQDPEPAADDKKDKKSKVKFDSLTLEVLNGKGEVIRTIKRKAPEESGVLRMTWDLSEKGVDFPSRNEPRGRGRFERGGMSVLPGTYTLRLSFGDQKDSTTINVKADPRIAMTDAVRLARYNMAKDVEKLTERTADATKRLRESLDVVEEFEKKIKEAKRDDLKSAQDKTKAMKDSINSIMDFIVGKEDKRQGLTRSSDPTTVSFIFTARGYIGSPITPINETDRRVYKQAEDRVTDTLNKVNAFFDGPWKEYRTMMEGISLSPFKDYEPIKK